MIPPWLVIVLKDIKAHRAYRELPVDLRDRIADGLQQAQIASAPPPEPEPEPPPVCPLCGGPGCGRCKPPTATLEPPPPRRPRAVPKPLPPEKPLAALEREAPDDLIAGRRLLLTKTGLSAKKLAKETGIAFAVRPRVDRIFAVFQTEIVKLGSGRYCFSHVDRSKSAPENQAHQTEE